jgi:hypothetical protein
MNQNTPSSSERVVKIQLPVPLIRQMDEAIVAEYGGYQTRAELIREAIGNLLTELRFPDAPAEPGKLRRPSVPAPLAPPGPRGDISAAPKPDGSALALPNGRESIDQIAAALPLWEREELTIGDLAGTAIVAPPKPHLIAHGVATAPDEALLGLHNRDYASVWAAQRLARYTSDGPIPFEEYQQRVTAAAWFFGNQLRSLEASEPGRKLTVLLPTNMAKRQSAERGFQHFAVGTIAREARADGLLASGPLFAWKMIQIAPGDDLLVGLTEEGWELLQLLEGLSLELPHAEAAAGQFLDYLATHASADREGFDHVLEVVADGPDRATLVASFAERYPQWTPAVANTNASGYIARSREWGLVEPKLVEGRYWLSDRGRAHRQRTPINIQGEGTGA